MDYNFYLSCNYGKEGIDNFKKEKGEKMTYNHNEPSGEDLITAQVIFIFGIVVVISFLVGLAIGGFYF